VSQRTLFLRIPRTASTAIIRGLHASGKTLWNADHERRLRKPKTNMLKQHACLGHRNIFSLVRGGIVSEEWVRSRFAFSFVRNPWARVLSCYAKMREWAPTFEEFVRRVTMGPIDSLSRYNTRGMSNLNPQLAWLRDDHGRIFTDFIGRFERLDEDWKVACKTAGINPVPPLSRCNQRRGLKKPWREYYTKETIRLVASFYAEEIEMFRYKFDDAS